MIKEIEEDFRKALENILGLMSFELKPSRTKRWRKDPYQDKKRGKKPLSRTVKTVLSSRVIVVPVEAGTVEGATPDIMTTRVTLPPERDTLGNLLPTVVRWDSFNRCPGVEKALISIVVEDQKITALWKYPKGCAWDGNYPKAGTIRPYKRPRHMECDKREDLRMTPKQLDAWDRRMANTEPDIDYLELLDAERDYDRYIYQAYLEEKEAIEDLRDMVALEADLASIDKADLSEAMNPFPYLEGGIVEINDDTEASFIMKGMHQI